MKIGLASWVAVIGVAAAVDVGVRADSGGPPARPALAPAPAPAMSGQPLDTHPVVRPSAEPVAVSAGVVTQVGEIVVMEGDDEIVTTLGPGDFGIDLGEQLRNVTQRFYLHYGDDFDGIAIFTTFPDLMQGGAAYSVGPGAGTKGIGYDAYGAAPYGSAGRLISVVNMNDVAGYASMSADDRWFATVMGQEFAHSWLAHLQFRDPVSGQPSNELLGRDGSHWSAIFNSGASVMDGVSFVDNGDGTFTVGAYSTGYGPLDLYAMGIIGPHEVTDLFVLRNARYADNDQPVNPVNDGWTGMMSPGRVVIADRVDFTIGDVVAVHGPRQPAWDEENEDWRVAFVLVTEPGVTAADVGPEIAKLEVGRYTWEQKHRSWSLDRSTMCTDVSAPCPLAVARPESAVVSEDPDHSDGDGIIEPGERARLTVTVRNDGTEDATEALAELSTESAGLILPSPETLPRIPAGQSITHTFHLKIAGDACGQDLGVDVRASIAHRSWRATASFRPGVIDAPPEGFATDAGWTVDAPGTDAVTSGAWAHGVPKTTFFAGRTLQPDGGASGPGDAAWFTDPEGRWDQGELNGTSTLYSAPIDARDLYAPILRYKLWYVALDRTPSSLTPSTEAHLVVEVSGDGGASWHEIDRVSGEPMRWVDREAPVPADLITGETVQFRFIAQDGLAADQRLVEVGIDDVAVLSLSASCRDTGGGCGCRAGAPTGAAPLAILVAFGLAGLLRRRRA